MTRARAWEEARPFVAPAVIVVIYLLVRLAFVELAGERGVITPGRVGVDTGLAVLALVTLVMRCVALIIVPLLVVYRLVMRAARQLAAPTTSSRK
jgi:hypothetical protein